MPDKKRQHYVPQFYLRLFSEDAASIGLHNLLSAKTIARASIKHQAYKPYYYGRDGRVEASLATIEGAASAVIHEIINNSRPPQRFSEGHHVLASYLMVQLARTVQAETDANEMVNKLGKELLQRSLTDPELLAALDDLKIELTHPMELTLRPALLEVAVILDMRFKLFHNVSGTPFITSDHPVVKHNELFSSEADISVTGLANSGLQLLLPLSPSFAIVFYDEIVYELGQPVSNIVRVASDAHARALNAFQWANAHENLYFAPTARLPQFGSDQAAFAALRQDEHVALETSTIMNAEGGQRGVLLSVQTQPASRQLHMPLFRCTVRPTHFSAIEHPPLRNPEWAYFIRGLTDDVENGRMTVPQFMAATRRIPTLRREKR